MSLVVRDVSVPPKVSSPFAAPEVVVGSYEIPMDSVGINFCVKRLDVTVGTFGVLATVPVNLLLNFAYNQRNQTAIPVVKSRGPILSINNYNRLSFP